MTESIYMVSVYRYRCSKRKAVRYPCIKLSEDEVAYFTTLERAEMFVRERGRLESRVKERKDYLGIYAFVVTELPTKMVMHCMCNQYLSLGVYLPDGTLWGKNDYCDFMPRDLSAKGYNMWGERNIFYGRTPEEIRFKPGDIVEVFGCLGNKYWSNEETNLAVIVDTPKTKDTITQMMNEYKASHEGYDLRPHAISGTFNEHLDTYKVLSLCCKDIDWSPAIVTFPPRFEIPTHLKHKLYAAYQQHIYDNTRRTMNL